MWYFLLEFLYEGFDLTDQTWKTFDSGDFSWGLVMGYCGNDYLYGCWGFGGNWRVVYVIGLFLVEEGKTAWKPFGYVEFWQDWTIFYLLDWRTVILLSLNHLEPLFLGQFLKNIEDIVILDMRIGKVKDKLHPIIYHDKVLQIIHWLGHIHCWWLLPMLDTVVCLLERRVRTYLRKTRMGCRWVDDGLVGMGCWFLLVGGVAGHGRWFR